MGMSPHPGLGLEPSGRPRALGLRMLLPKCGGFWREKGRPWGITTSRFSESPKMGRRMLVRTRLRDGPQSGTVVCP